MPRATAPVSSNLEKIENAAKRMSHLINDLLNFSRTTLDEEKFVATDLNEIMINIKNDFELLIEQKKAIIHHDSLPVIEAIPLQMNQLLYNLLSNALKFSHPDKDPIINIAYSVLPADEVKHFPNLNPARKYYEIVIHDNGIGFDQKYAEQIFIIFQRVAQRNVFEGSGIGLVLCRKIINHHRGEIYAVSKENGGTTFFVTAHDVALFGQLQNPLFKLVPCSHRECHQALVHCVRP